MSKLLLKRGNLYIGELVSLGQLQKFADRVVSPVAFDQIIGSEDLLVKKCPSEEAAFGFRLCLPNRQ
jgi:hypothetical protein